MKLAILGNPNGWYVRQLKRAAASHGGIEIDVLSFDHLQASIDIEGKAAVSSRRLIDQDFENMTSQENDSWKVTRIDQHYQALLVRTMPLGSLEQIIFRMNALHLAKAMGVQVFNDPKTLEIAIDKWLTLDHCRRIGIDVPATICCQDRDSAIAAFETLGRDVVVKPIFGGEGRGIMRVDDPDMAWRVFSTLSQLGAVIYVQQRLLHRGFDLRILFIGEESFCVARHTAPNEWRTNISQGGLARIHVPTERQMEIARAAKECLNADMVGVDILPTQDGRDVLLEINAVPGWRGTQAALGVDISKNVLDFICRKVN